MTFDAASRTFTFNEATDLTQTDTSGPNYFKDYTVTITGTSGTETADGSFILKVKNPCVDPSLSQITSPADEVREYKIG